MVDYFFFLFSFLSAINITIKGSNNYFNDYMDISTTNSIKGIFVWLIIFHHKTGYINHKNYLYLNITRNLGQKIVSMFLFYSGYGIYESFKKKGKAYIMTLPIKAFILFVKFQIILLFFLLTNIFIFKHKISIKLYLLSAIFKSSLGNSNWFAFTIIILYIYTYISFMFIKGINFIGIIILSILCFFHVLIVYEYYYPNMKYAVDTVFCFSTGFFYSLMKNYLDKVIQKNDIYYFLIVSANIFLFFKILNINRLFYISLKNILFSLIIVLISMKIKFKNELLIFLSSHSYSIYLLQRLVMRITFKYNIFKNSDFIQISFEFTSIFFIACLFDKYAIFIDKYFKRKSIKAEKNDYIQINEIYFNDKINKNLIKIKNKIFDNN